jgi:hypothetical protein
MPDDHMLSGPFGRQPENPRENADAGRQHAKRSSASVEEHRGSAAAARDAAIAAVHATAESLEATLDGMRVMEEMRQTLRDIRGSHTRDSN